MIINRENYVAKAEEAIQQLMCKTDRNGRRVPAVSATKLQNLLIVTGDIYIDVRDEPNEQLPIELIDRINYMKVRYYFQAGADTSIRMFLECADVLNIINEMHGKRTNFLLFYRYMEALVAFYRFYGSMGW